MSEVTRDKYGMYDPNFTQLSQRDANSFKRPYELNMIRKMYLSSIIQNRILKRFPSGYVDLKTTRYTQPIHIHFQIEIVHDDWWVFKPVTQDEVEGFIWYDK